VHNPGLFGGSIDSPARHSANMPPISRHHGGSRYGRSHSGTAAGTANRRRADPARSPRAQRSQPATRCWSGCRERLNFSAAT
jgi:hypothetical protein